MIKTNLLIQMLLLFAGNPENFRNFIHEMSINHEFQKERVLFPLKVERLNVWDFEIIEDTIESSEWVHQNFLRDNDESFTTICFSEECSFSSLDQIILGTLGRENGIFIRYHFRLINEKWYLYKIQDYST